MARVQTSSKDDDKVQRPAVLVNASGAQLVDPLEGLCGQLDEVARTVTRHYLSSMQKQIDLDNPKPTLAQRSRFNRLNKLNAILLELTEMARHLNKWRTKHASISSEVKKLVDKSIQRLAQISSKLHHSWVGLGATMDSLVCLTNCQSIERKVIEYHVSLEDVLETLIRLTLRLQKNPDVVQLNNLPMVPDNLARIEMSFPVKLPDHETVAREMHAK